MNAAELVARAVHKVGVITKVLKSTWMARCPDCKTPKRLEPGTEVIMWGKKPSPDCPNCGTTMITKLLHGHFNEEKCGAKCMASKGPSCECSCGGANHGRNWI